MRARNNFFLISRRSEYARKFAYVGRKPRPLKSIKESVVGKPVVKHLRKKLYCLRLSVSYKGKMYLHKERSHAHQLKTSDQT